MFNHQDPYNLPFLCTAEMEAKLDRLNGELSGLLENIALKLGRFDGSFENKSGKLDYGINRKLLEGDTFIQLFLRSDSQSSSRIEGVNTSVEESLPSETKSPAKSISNNDLKLMTNNQKATWFGLSEAVNTGAINNDTIKKMHSLLFKDVDCDDPTPGSFRKEQNYVGHTKFTSTGKFTEYIPPIPTQVKPLMDDLIKFWRESRLPKIFKAAIIHGQFESVHPFLDGNGRVGRMLVPIFLFESKATHYPCMFISSIIESNKSLYYDALQSIRDSGKWNDWLIFFIEAMGLQIEWLSEKRVMFSSISDKLDDQFKDAAGLRIHVEKSFGKFAINHFTFTSKRVCEHFDISRQTARRIIEKLVQQNVLVLSQKPSGSQPGVYGSKDLFSQFRDLPPRIKVKMDTSISNESKMGTFTDGRF